MSDLPSADKKARRAGQWLMAAFPGAQPPVCWDPSLGGPDEAPGGAWAPGAGGLTCTDRHAAHGESGQYRNLVLKPGTAESERRITYNSCMSCHKAHRNRNPFGLLYMSGRGQLTEEGDTGGGKYIHLCQQCHQQGL
jgi:hypothetical protein